MILTDTGPLVALVDSDDANHTACETVLPTVSPSMVTPWPCFTESMHLLGRAGGHRAQDALWEYVAQGLVHIHERSVAEQIRMRELMEKYGDTPMDLADAALVAAAEALEVTCIFTIDSDFYVYRLADSTALEVTPGPRRSSQKRR